MDRVHPGVRGPLTEGPCFVHVVGNVPRLVRNPIKRTFEKFDLKVISRFALRISYSTKQDGRREKEHLT